MVLDSEITPITDSELIAIQALLELRTNVRIHNANDEQQPEENSSPSSPNPSGPASPEPEEQEPIVENEPSNRRIRNFHLLPNLDEMEAMCYKLYHKIESWAARIEAQRQSNDDDDEETSD